MPLFSPSRTVLTTRDQATHIAIRADASAAIGTGHLKRCLSLAQALIEAGADVRFVCRALDAVAATVLGDSGIPTLWLSAPAQAFTPAPDAPPHAAWAGAYPVAGWQSHLASAAQIITLAHAMSSCHPLPPLAG